MLKRINNWFLHAKKYFFAYKNGFYEVSYMGNSPAYMVASIKKMPFVKHDAAAQKLTTNNPFAKGIMHYQEIEEGLKARLLAKSDHKLGPTRPRMVGIQNKRLTRERR